MSHVPTRTCVGCAGRSPQGGLVRFVATPRGLRLDPDRRAPGRGAYLHPASSCWTAFVQRRGPVRSLRLTPARAEREQLVETLVARQGSQAPR